MRKRRLGIDIDGTVTDPGTFIPYLNNHFNQNLTLNDLTQYELSTILNITKEDFWNWMKEHEPTIYKNAELAIDAKSILTNWKKDHELYYISARPKHVHNLTIEWFLKLQLPYDHIELLGKHHKLEAVKEHNIEVFFEDKHDNACDIAEECDIPVILLDTPYNRDPVHKLVYRAYNWKEAKAITENIFNEK
ncbi:hypothetical protein ACERII_18765 [Evansella sp. AB-rgal1]|uniref:5' nucleotidase, NT5C type n=1 Tax=Evansella sp. AB-rgal1 TaxID=3242696 RepID=UPI00359D265D